MDEFPDLKLCLGHAGGYVAFGIARMDKGWRAGALPNQPEFDDARSYIKHAPSEYLRSFYYDCCTHSEATLRFLLDTVGADRVMLGTDWRVRWTSTTRSLDQEPREPDGRREGGHPLEDRHRVLGL